VNLKRPVYSPVGSGLYATLMADENTKTSTAMHTINFFIVLPPNFFWFTFRGIPSGGVV